jgi:hypothetical protein
VREIKYTILPAMGPDATHAHGTVKDLLMHIPYLFMKGFTNVIPPLPILNKLLTSGINDAGMSGGCRWKPFEITESEYSELVEELLTEPGFEFITPETPHNVKTHEDWCIWKVQFLKKG